MTFNNLLEDWGISKNAVVSVTTDNAANMKAAFKTETVWMSCFGHNLNLAIGKSLKIDRVDVAIKACRSVVQGFNHSWKRRRELAKIQMEMNIPQHTLVQDVVTRWGSTYDMVSRFVEQHAAVAATLMADRNTRHLVLKGAYISTLEDTARVLKPLRAFTDSLSSETCISVSALKPVLLHLTEDILAMEDGDSNLVGSMKSAIKQDLLSRYLDPKIADLVIMTCALDPRVLLKTRTYFLF
ncbi:E3 SUMO-protein ligase ZBED1-like [Sardina pilchardus]|uniref:E3 SUMO-protein ligase ZBED1-like n=1 Tax=Sardina pilchardus TaxID=27697 RepID=UPI002E11394E